MKPFRIVLGIVGVTIVIVVTLGVRSKIDYDKDEREILQLIGEYKALGVPTNGNEIVRKISDRDNAWIEVGPHMTTKRGNGTGMVFKSKMPANILETTGPDNAGSLRTYLAVNQAERDTIEGLLDAKPGMQVPHDYNEGFAMLLPEFAAIRPLAREYCDAAYADALEGNWDTAKKHLDLANHLATACLVRPELIAEAVGSSIRKTIYQTGYRIIEVKPELQAAVEDYLGSPELNTVADQKHILESEFVAELTLARNFDSPEADRPVYPAPFDKIIRSADQEKLQKMTTVNGGDYMPNSHVLRKFLLARLRAWKPFMNQMMKSGIPSDAEYEKIGDVSQNLPKNLSFIGQMTPIDQYAFYRALEFSQQYSDMNKAILKAVHLRPRMAEYPRSLDSLEMIIHSLIPSDKPIYTATETSIMIKAFEPKPGATESVPVLSFPISLSQKANSP